MQLDFSHILLLFIGMFPVILQSICAWILWKKSKKHSTNLGSNLHRSTVTMPNIFNKTDLFQRLMWTTLFCLVLYIAFFTVRILAPDYYAGIYKQKEMLVSVVIGLTGIVITIYTLLITLNKNYYVCFSVKDVLAFLGFNSTLFGTGISCIIICILASITPDYLPEGMFGWTASLLFVLAALNICYALKSMAILYQLTFSESKIELNLLKQIHLVLHYEKFVLPSSPENKNWNKDGANICVHYLCEKYIESCSKCNVESLAKCNFVSLLGIYDGIWHRRACKLAFIVSTFWSIFFFWTAAKTGVSTDICIAMGIVQFVVLVIYAIIHPKWMKESFVKLYLGEWGYHIISSSGKETFCSDGLVSSHGRYKKMIDRMEDLVSFFHIQDAIAAPNDMMLEEAKEMYTLLRCNTMSAIYYLPAFLIGYLLYKKNNAENITFLQDLYASLCLKDKEEYEFSETLYSHIFFLERGQYVERDAVDMCYGEYIFWLRGEQN